MNRKFPSLLMFLLAGALCAEAALAETVWFEVAEIETERDQSFLVPLSDPAHIAHARALIANGGRPSDTLDGILLADIRAGGDGFNRDIRDPNQRLWRWHVSRVEGFGGLAIELCDGWPGFVDENPEAFIQNTNGVICFWGYTIKSELSAPPQFAMSAGLNGAWFNPETAGQGVYVDVMAEQGLVALAWFTWAQGAPGAARAGEHLWFSGLGEIAGNASNQDLYSSRGGRFNGAPTVQTETTGSAVLSFKDCDNGLMSFSFNSGESGEIALRRVVPRPGCVR